MPLFEFLEDYRYTFANNTSEYAKSLPSGFIYDVYSRIISRLCEDVIHYLCRSNYTSHYA